MAASEQSKFIYAFVASGRTVLAEYSAFKGNFPSLAVECLQSLPKSGTFSFTHHKHIFNYVVEGGFAYMVLVEETLPQYLAFGFLENVKFDFSKYRKEAQTAPYLALNETFGPKLKERMGYMEAHPQEFDKFAKITAQVHEVEGVMKEAIDKALRRGEKLEILIDKTDQLREQAHMFQKTSEHIQTKMWYENLKVKLVVVGVLILLAFFVYLSICGGITCN